MTVRTAEMTFQEIGDRLGCSPQRAEQIYQQAMAKLRLNPKMAAILRLAQSKEYAEL